MKQLSIIFLCLFWITGIAWGEKIRIGGHLGVGEENSSVNSISVIEGYVDYDINDRFMVRGSMSILSGTAKGKEISDGEFEMIGGEISLIGKVDRGTSVTPFMGAGIGGYLIENDLSARSSGAAGVINIDIEENFEPAPGFHILGGVILNISASADVEFAVKYIYTRPEMERDIRVIDTGETYTLKDRVQLNTFTLCCGLRFHF